MVCREGYRLRPTDLLGVYTYSKRVNLGVRSSGNARGDCVYTTVSHFNIIHFQCHHEAKRADAAIKNPNKEWDGAALRNNETLCNNTFPLRGTLFLWDNTYDMSTSTKTILMVWAMPMAAGSSYWLMTWFCLNLNFQKNLAFEAFSKELLSWLEDITSTTDLEEAFDIIGALSDHVLGCGYTKCEEFVLASINGDTT